MLTQQSSFSDGLNSTVTYLSDDPYVCNEHAKRPPPKREVVFLHVIER